MSIRESHNRCSNSFSSFLEAPNPCQLNQTWAQKSTSDFDSQEAATPLCSNCRKVVSGASMTTRGMVPGPDMMPAKRLLLHSTGVLTILCILVVGLLVPVYVTKMSLEGKQGKGFICAILVVNILLTMGISDLYVECANILRFSLLAQNEHDVQHADLILRMASLTSSMKLLSSAFTQKRFYSIPRLALPWKTVVWVLALVIFSIGSRLGVALLGLTFDREIVTLYRSESSVLVTNLTSVGRTTSIEAQQRTAQSYGEAYINMFQSPTGPFDVRGLHEVSSSPPRYRYTFTEWDTYEKLALGRYSGRTIEVGAECSGFKVESITHEGGHDVIAIFNGSSLLSVQSVRAPLLSNRRSTFWSTDLSCGNRCSIIHAYRPMIDPNTEPGRVDGTFYSCNVEITEVQGRKANQSMYQISDQTARNLASAISLSNEDVEDPTLRWTTYPLDSRAAPFIFDYGSNTTPKEDTMSEEWVQRVVTQFTTAAVSYMDGANDRILGVGMQSVTAARLSWEFKYTMVIFGCMGTVALVICSFVCYESRSLTPLPDSIVGLGYALSPVLSDEPEGNKMYLPDKRIILEGSKFKVTQPLP